MKRLVTVLAFATAACAAFAQSFTIISPRDGQRVREVVEVTFPKDSVPAGSFIGVSVDGKFVEAVVPDLDTERGVLVYKMNTKAMGIQDGERTLSVARYQRTGSGTAVTDRSEVKVIVANLPEIKVSEDGLSLRYKFRPGARWTYSLRIGLDQAMMTEAQNRMGGRAAQRPVFEERSRMLFAIDDVKPGGLGLVRSQLIPYAGEDKDYLYITISGQPGQQVIHKNLFAPVYRLLTTTGVEEYADAPHWQGFFGTSHRSVERSVYSFMSLPILPTQPQRVGDAWTGSIAIPASSLERVHQEGRSHELLRARGVFEAVEYEQGRQCAKIRYTVELAERGADSDTLEIAGREFRANERLRWQQVFWLDLNEGFIVRSDITFTADVRIDVPTTAQGAAAGGPGGAQGPVAAGASGGAAAGDRGIQGQRGGPMSGPGGQGGPTPGTAGGGPGGIGGPPPGGQGGASVFVRDTVTIHMILER